MGRAREIAGQAVLVLRRRATAGAGRVASSAWPLVQCAIGAAAAWVLAREVVGHEAPVFAAVAATVCLGVSQGQRLRRVIELGVGVTIGVALGDLLISVIGRGWWQIGVIVALGMGFAQFLGGGTLITTQSGLQGIFLMALPQADSGLSRWQDALLGAVIALVVAATLPGDPAGPVRAQAQTLITELADVVRQAAAAVRTHDPVLAEAALDRARATQGDLERWQTALRDGEDIATISPLRRHRRAELRLYRRTLVGVDRATRNMRVGVRRIDAALERGERLPEPIAGVLDDLAASLAALRHEIGRDLPDGEAAHRLSALAGRLDPHELCADSLSATVVVAQVRSAVVDLLEATGTDTESARAQLPR